MGMGTPMRGQTNTAIQRNKLQRSLRGRMTIAELRLWHYLRGRQMAGFKFRRQHPFNNYILDFACIERMLVIEVDGGQHMKNTAADQIRTKSLENAGFRVLRFWNSDVLKNIDAVAAVIRDSLQGTSPPSR